VEIVLKSEAVTGNSVFEVTGRRERRRPLGRGVTAEHLPGPRQEIENLTSLLLHPRIHGYILSSTG
jgi:hypothetical protein